MICFLVSRGYGFTLRPLQEDAKSPEITILTYDKALYEKALPKATYVFVDLDRLGNPDLVAAGRLFRRLAAQGCRVLNDPTRVRKRLPLLRSLHRVGINTFNAYSVEETDTIKQFPVFVRVADDHKGPLTDLIPDQETLERALNALTEIGYPSSGLIVVEYAAKPVRSGIFRKLSVFRIADRYLPHVCVHDVNWIIKEGRSGVAPSELYDEELEILRTNPFAERMKKAFEIAAIDFGRVDFSFVDGRPCIYEINTNPTIAKPYPHPFPQRVESMGIWWGGLLAALHEINEPSERASQVDVSVDDATTLRKALDIYPSIKDGFLHLSEALSRNDHRAAAVQHARLALAETPDDPRVVLAVSKLVAKNGSSEEAIDLAKRALELDPNSVELLLHNARLLIRAKRGREALGAVNRAISVQPNEVKCYRALSEAQKQLGDSKAALEATKIVEQLISENDGPAAARELKELRSQRRTLQGGAIRQHIRDILHRIRPLSR